MQSFHHQMSEERQKVEGGKAGECGRTIGDERDDERMLRPHVLSTRPSRMGRCCVMAVVQVKRGSSSLYAAYKQ